MFQASFLGPELPDGGGSCDSGREEQHEAARDGPDRQSVPTPQPLESPAAGACGSGPGAGPPSEQAEEPGPFSVGLSIQDFLPAAQGAEQPVLTSAAPILDEALQTIGLDLPPLAPSAAADTGPSGPQEYDFRTVLRPAVAAPASPGALQTAGGSLGSEGQRLREDTHVQPDTCVPDGRVALPHTHPPQHPSHQEESSQATGQLCGQVAEPGVPTEGYASGMALSRPRWNVHGHVSDASIRVGENVWDVTPSRPRWNVHGHVSQSSVMLGVLSGEAEPNVPGPPRAPPDHGSQSGLSLGVQSPAREQEPRLPAETASGGSGAQVAGPGSGRGEESSLQAVLSAEAAPAALEDGIPEEPGQWGPQGCPVTGGVREPRGGGGRAGEKLAALGTWWGAALRQVLGPDAPSYPVCFAQARGRVGTPRISLQVALRAHRSEQTWSGVGDRESGECVLLVGPLPPPGLLWAVRAPSWDWAARGGFPPPRPFSSTRGEQAGSLRLGCLRRAWTPGAAQALARRRPSAGTGSRPTWRAWRGSIAWSSTRTATRPCVSGLAVAGGSLAGVSLVRDRGPCHPCSRASCRPPPAPRASPSFRRPRGPRGPVRRGRERGAAERAAATARAHEALHHGPAGCPVSACPPGPPRPALLPGPPCLAGQ